LLVEIYSEFQWIPSKPTVEKEYVVHWWTL